jgi:hypothetical protein
MELDKSDKEYWEQYEPKEQEDFGFSQKNHELGLDVVIKIRGPNSNNIYEVRENDINCNTLDLETWFNNLKKTIRMVDETISDKAPLF